jgi:hypothetical protein
MEPVYESKANTNGSHAIAAITKMTTSKNESFLIMPASLPIGILTQGVTDQ